MMVSDMVTGKVMRISSSVMTQPVTKNSLKYIMNKSKMRAPSRRKLECGHLEFANHRTTPLAKKTRNTWCHICHTARGALTV